MIGLRAAIGVIVVGFIVTAASLTTLGVVGSREDKAGTQAGETRPLRRVTSEQLAAYEDGITAAAKHGGFVVENGLKVGLRQIAAGEGNAVPLQAVGWVGELENVRAEFKSKTVGLERTDVDAIARAFDAALVQYIETAELIGAAAIASGEPRAQLLQKAADAGRRADAAYDKAGQALQHARRDAGLPPTDRFPAARSTSS